MPPRRKCDLGDRWFSESRRRPFRGKHGWAGGWVARVTLAAPPSSDRSARARSRAGLVLAGSLLKGSDDSRAPGHGRGPALRPCPWRHSGSVSSVTPMTNSSYTVRVGRSGWLSRCFLRQRPWPCAWRVYFSTYMLRSILLLSCVDGPSGSDLLRPRRRGSTSVSGRRRVKCKKWCSTAVPRQSAGWAAPTRQKRSSRPDKHVQFSNYKQNQLLNLTTLFSISISINKVWIPRTNHIYMLLFSVYRRKHWYSKKNHGGTHTCRPPMPRPIVKGPHIRPQNQRASSARGRSLACPIHLIPSAPRAHPLHKPLSLSLGLPHQAHPSAEPIRRPAGHVELTRAAASALSPVNTFSPTAISFFPLRSPPRELVRYLSAHSEPSLSALVLAVAKRWSWAVRGG